MLEIGEATVTSLSSMLKAMILPCATRGVRMRTLDVYTGRVWEPLGCVDFVLLMV